MYGRISHTQILHRNAVFKQKVLISIPEKWVSFSSALSTYIKVAIKTPSTVTEETETRLVEDLSLERALVLSIISCSEKNYLRNRFRKGQHSLHFRSGNLRHYEITERLRVMQWDNGREGGIRKNLTNLYLLSYFKTCQFYEILQIYCETFFWKARPWAELRFPSILS